MYQRTKEEVEKWLHVRAALVHIELSKEHKIILQAKKDSLMDGSQMNIESLKMSDSTTNQLKQSTMNQLNTSSDRVEGKINMDIRIIDFQQDPAIDNSVLSHFENQIAIEQKNHNNNININEISPTI